MRRLVPDVAEIDLADAYAGLVLAAPPVDQDRASVALGMVTSVDGAVTVDGTSGPLGADADRHAFRRLRDACDAILVGAGTVRAEDYGPPRAPGPRAAARVAAGLAPAPQLLVVTAGAALDPGARLFTAERDAGVPPPVVVTRGGAPEEPVRELEAVAEVVRFGDDEVDLAAALRWCRARGWSRVLCEGGPALNASLLAVDVVDEVFLTLAPTLVGGDAARMVAGAPSGRHDLELVELHEHGGELLLRYRCRPARPGRPAD